MVQCNLVFFSVKEPLLAPTELVHLFRERVLSKNLLSASVSLREKWFEFEIELTAPTRSSENGLPSLYALRILLNLTSRDAKVLSPAQDS
jgi:hypothetical protein